LASIFAVCRATSRLYAPAVTGHPRQLPTRQMIVDIVGDFLADLRQIKHLVLDERIVRLFGKFSIHHRLMS
jgi:hypothetical protein